VDRPGEHCPHLVLVLDLDVVWVVEGSTRRWSRSKTRSRSRTRAPSHGARLMD